MKTAFVIGLIALAFGAYAGGILGVFAVILAAFAVEYEKHWLDIHSSQ